MSMVDGQLFDILAALAVELRKTRQPFGGIQVGRSDRNIDMQLRTL